MATQDNLTPKIHCKSVAAPAILVPRFVRGLESLAQKKGFEVSIERFGRGDELHLVGAWRGTRRQFQSLKFAVSSFALPAASCTKAVVMNRFSPVRAGRVDVEGNEVLFTPDFGEVPERIEYRYDVEVAHYAKRIAYHGTIEALIALGIPKKRLKFSKTTPLRQGQSLESFGRCEWDARLQPDGTVLYRDDTELAERARRKLTESARQEHKRWVSEEAARYSEQDPAATCIDAAAVPLQNLSYIASYFSPELAAKIGESIGVIKGLLQIERERLDKRQARPLHLRLVINHTTVQS
jgi:hypothetical protein